MKLTQLIAWIGLVTLCLVVAIAQTPLVTGVKAIGIPEDARANDLAHWETLIDQEDVSASWSHFSGTHATLISSGVKKIGQRTAFLLGNRDGHVIEAVESGKTQAHKSQER